MIKTNYSNERHVSLLVTCTNWDLSVYPNSTDPFDLKELYLILQSGSCFVVLADNQLGSEFIHILDLHDFKPVLVTEHSVNSVCS